MRRAAALIASIFAATAAVHARAQPSGEPLPAAVRIEVSGGSDNFGEMVLAFLENGAEITRIHVPIPKGTPENDVAGRIHKEVRRALSPAEYEVFHEDGEKIRVVAVAHARSFEIRLVSDTVEGAEVDVTREPEAAR